MPLAMRAHRGLERISSPLRFSAQRPCLWIGLGTNAAADASVTWTHVENNRGNRCGFAVRWNNRLIDKQAEHTKNARTSNEFQ